MKKRKQKRAKRLSFLLIILVALFVHMRLLAPNAYRLRIEVIENEKIPASFDQSSIAYFSDIYDDQDNFKKAMADIKALKPDMILFGGNLSQAQLDEKTKKLYEKELKAIKAPLGKFTVISDQDIVSGNYQILENADFSNLNESGVPVFHRSQEAIYLSSYDEQSEAIQIDEKKFLITVSNDPKNIPAIASDLVLSGKYLGGQMILPFLGPLRGEGPYYQKRYDKKSQSILISQGLGTLESKMRLGTRPELIWILLENGHES